MPSVIDPSDASLPAFMGSDVEKVNSNLIFDRGRLVGLWDFDPEANEIVWATFRPEDTTLAAEIAKTQEFVKDQLGDARTFSLDSPESRKPRIKALRALVDARLYEIA
jgi:hypothetical protein